MKDPQINLMQNSMAGYLQSLGFKRKFLRLWGTMTIDGVEVLHAKKYWYPKERHLEANEKLFRLLKMYKDLNEAQPKGIESAWISINPDKVDVTYDTEKDVHTFKEATLVDETLAQQINDGLELNKKFEVTITIKSDTYPEPELTEDIEDETSDEFTKRVGSYVVDNYADIFDKCYIEGDGENYITRTASKYALFDEDNNFDVEVATVSKVVTEQPFPPGQDAHHNSIFTEDGSYQVMSHAVVLNITRVSAIYKSDAIITKMIEAGSYDSSEKDDLIRVMGYFTDIPVSNHFFYKGHMRASAFSTSMLKTEDCNKLLSGSLDSGYRRKRAKWYKRLLVIIVVIVLTVITAPQGGWGGAAGAKLIAAVAWTATVIALALAALSMAMSAWGDDEGAGFAAKMSSIGSKIAAIFGIINVFNNMTNMLTEEAARQSLKEAGKEVTKEALKEQMKVMAREMTIGQAYEAAKELVSKQINKMMTISVTNSLKMFNQVANLWMKNKIDKKNTALEEKQNELQEARDQQAAAEAGMNRDLAWDFIRTHTSPITTDQSVFNAEEYKYEPERFTFTTGNILRGHISGYGRTAKDRATVEAQQAKEGRMDSLGSSSMGNIA